MISAAGIRKSYGRHEVLKGVSLDVSAGEVFALLGPNGAGKTTLVEILEGYRFRDRGEVSVLGFDPESGGRGFRERIGIVLQSAGVDRRLRVGETMALFAGYYPRPRSVDSLLADAGLTSLRDRRVRTLSGGEQRRLDLALALVGDPEVVFLDEPTTGFDPEARRAAWRMVAGLRARGCAVFLTTHSMEEAHRLADRVAILLDGQIAASGRPDDLAGDGIEIRYRDAAGAEVVMRPVSDDDALAVLRGLHENATAVEGLRVGRPTLEDVYLDLTRREDGV